MTVLEPVRFALYASLGLAFGVPAAAVLTRAQAGLGRLRPLLAGTVLAALPLSLIGYLLAVAEMAGSSLRDLDWQLVFALATGSAFGWAFLARVAALGLAAILCIAMPRRLVWLAVPAAIALATLAWAGHAGVGEGAQGLLRLAGDIVHLLAASIWLGALALFVALLWRPDSGPGAVADALARFAGVGSVVVVTLGVTGLANIWFLAGPGSWLGLVTSDYGLLLAGKLALFGSMLALAALNRFVLVPRLLASATHRDEAQALARLKLSIGAELGAACAVLLVVARLGMIDPGTM
ncbi:copper homeostasis membrane protein CopD [Altererythrobacter fulvus]|uniref:copper homeostasis membrane protein CopD n=1 Tax=Caenibius fulvus TaxID=2126012 RepID=UPI003015D2D3